MWKPSARNSLHQRNYGVDIQIVSSGGPLADEISRLRVACHYAAMKKGATVIDYARALRTVMDIVKKENVQIIHAHARIPAYIGFAASKLTSARLLTVFHGPYRRNLLNRIMVNSDHILAVSDSIKEYLSSVFRIDEAKVSVIHNGISRERFENVRDSTSVRRELGISDNAIVIGTVGRLVEGKGVEWAIRSIDLIKNSYPNVFYVVVGDGHKRASLEELATDLGLNERIIFTGTRYDVPSLINAMDVFLVPSEYESFGIVVLEGMFMGKPVIACNVGGIPEIISSNVHGVLIPPRDPDAIANAIENLIVDVDERHKSQSAVDDELRHCSPPKPCVLS